MPSWKGPKRIIKSNSKSLCTVTYQGANRLGSSRADMIIVFLVTQVGEEEKGGLPLRGDFLNMQSLSIPAENHSTQENLGERRLDNALNAHLMPENHGIE
ncbi:hypothetical protein WISP_110908 [Willisornis vidua]|uniref:Uncharacterized protein n=1 Tax=Willisornis vidua TaxID=1566151 RepID=A0ABQ9CVP8_9PASS|nr:hypothetical protein WISP_110908 [Willisornis vidua]